MDENKQKEAGIDPFFKKILSVFRINVKQRHKILNELMVCFKNSNVYLETKNVL